MDFARLPSYRGDRSPPDPGVPAVSSPAVVATADGSHRPVGWDAWADVLFLDLTTTAAAAPLCFLVAVLDGLNDKPGGSHASALSYLKVVLVSALAAGVADLVRRAIGRPRTFEGRVFVPILLGGAVVLVVGVTFCLWGSWVFET